MEPAETHCSQQVAVNDSSKDFSGEVTTSLLSGMKSGESDIEANRTVEGARPLSTKTGQVQGNVLMSSAPLKIPADSCSKSRCACIKKVVLASVVILGLVACLLLLPRTDKEPTKVVSEIEELDVTLDHEKTIERTGGLVGGNAATGPSWTQGDMEPPQGEKDMGGWTAAVYTEEQQTRLGVTETGEKVTEVEVEASESSDETGARTSEEVEGEEVKGEEVEAEICADSPMQHCRMMCREVVMCPLNYCKMRQGHCCDFQCQPITPSEDENEVSTVMTQEIEEVEEQQTQEHGSQEEGLDESEASSYEPVATQRPMYCMSMAIRRCQDGSVTHPNPALNCRHDPCPEDAAP
eukprot:CAMPEP_0197845036 /NCGR_PEP_ID=MMETSP1438-20131217/1990_1 /TAXON_ID=1461541 /ORGANISM="Pterosperma sp., Strain CCMP1384" /LENGTH=350 /DNA_ID=CAMNT_0043456121 /DNA_START=206 /DNA_END=1258 /DNA_ORIENTATION=-